MKRSSSVLKKTPVSDFKRLKSRVGKRAPKKLNDTDTKFSTAKVKVKVQNVILNSTAFDEHTMQMVSSKGKKLSQLILSMNHPSSTVRSSSLQGIRDAIKNTSAHVIPYHLSVIMPSVSKCIVDDHVDVRKLAHSILFENISLQLLSVNLEDRLRPFIQLTLAYISSALHSLDQDVRYDGCCALENLCTQLRSLFLDDSRGMNDLLKLESTLPAFSILFDDVSGGLASLSRRGIGNLSAIDKNATLSKKKKKVKDISHSSINDSHRNENRSKTSIQKAARGEGVLKAFLAVMKITTFSKTSFFFGDDFTQDKSSHDLTFTQCESLKPSLTLPDLKFLPGGRDVNSILMNRTYSAIPSRSSPILSNFEDILSSQVYTSRLPHYKLGNCCMTLKIQRELMLKLRDRYVEVTQRGYNGENGIYLSPRDANECILIINNLRLLWCGYSRENVLMAIDSNSNIFDAETTQLKKVACSVLRLILDTFIIADASGNSNSMHQHHFDLLNASICMILSELGSAVSDSSFDKEWLNVIFSYVIPQLDRDDLESSVSKVSLLKVVEKLLLDTSLLGQKDYFQLLDALENSYFSQKSITSGYDGRCSARLLSSVIQRYLEGALTNVSTKSIADRLTTMASSLPRYLIEWEGDAPEDSAILLATLLAMTRQLGSSEQPSEVSLVANFYASLRDIIHKLFLPSDKVKDKQSVFEKLPMVAQRMVISLLGVIGYPSDSILKSLAEICSRRSKKTLSEPFNQVKSDDVLDYIFSVVHLVRHTISCQSYLTFLVASSGISSIRYKIKTEISEFKSENSNDLSIAIFSESEIEFITSHEKAIQRFCRYVSFSQTKTTFQMLTPIFHSWLQQSDSKVVSVVKNRAAFAALAVLSAGGEVEIMELLDSLIIASFHIFLCVFRSDNNRQQDLNLEDFKTSMTMPIHVLFNYQPALFIKFIKKCLSEVLSSIADLDDKRTIIQTLERLVRNKMQEKEICPDVTVELLHSAALIDEFSNGGPLDRFGGALRIAARQLSSNA